MSDLGRYAIGEQSFEELRTKDAVYVDKTMFAYKVLSSKSKYFFLARPRRFGKSLFMSTLKSIYSCQRDLFKGLFIDLSDWQWEEYPVLYLDLNTPKYKDPQELFALLNNRFSKWEELYGITADTSDLSVRFQNIIETAHEVTGKKVVILVDEYDKPLVHNLSDMERYEHFRSQLSGVYSSFKSSADHIQLAFLTGVTRFSKLSVFSDLNNIQDISFNNEYADICGITMEELIHYYPDSIKAMAEVYDIDVTETLERLKKNYDGYRFSNRGSEIFNPWSLLNAFANREIANYWNETAMPTILVEMLKRMDVDLQEYLNAICGINELRGLDLLNPRPLPLLYQTGYLTIKKYDPEYEEYTLGIPNREVEGGLFDLLLPMYANLKYEAPDSYVRQFSIALRNGDAEDFMKKLSNFFASIDYSLKIENENNFHNAFYIFIHLLGIKIDTEVRTSDGRIDLLIQDKKYIYIIELKFNSDAEEALQQIKDKDYASKYAADPRKLILIGASFDSGTRRLSDYLIEYI